MKKYILILILFSCQKTIQPANLIETNAEEWNKTMLWNEGPFNYQGITKVGLPLGGIPGWDMLQTEKGAIADARTENSSFDVTMWCKGFDVITWVDGHFGSYTVNIKSDKYSSDHFVNVSDTLRELRTTFSILDLYPDNYQITIVPEPDKTFIFYSMIKYVDFDPIPDSDSTIYTIPDPIDCEPDTIYADCPECPEVDTIKIYIPGKDSIIYQNQTIEAWIKVDSLTYKLK